MSSFQAQKFGKYHLIDKIAVGGMAEIYKAKTFGVDGFEKQLAIKKILSHYSNDKDFISMLTDEAKLVVLLSHTNIIQVYDLGKVGDDYYISMEYIDGVNLREILEKSKKLETSIPLPICLFIASEILKGLDYAHSRRNLEGQELGIVHRDISPQNILVSYEGETKIADFGIAKAAMNVSHTTEGIIKGKASYMSPEQATGGNLDYRTDIFSTGLILYELITGTRLFYGESQLEILKKIKETTVSEDTLDKNIPKDIRTILAKALSYDAEDRYNSASDFQIELTKILYSNYSDFSPKQLSALIKEWFHTELNIKQILTQQEPGRTSITPKPGDSESLVKYNPDEESEEILLNKTTLRDDMVFADDLIHDDNTAEHEASITASISIKKELGGRSKNRVFFFLAAALISLGLVYYFWMR